MIIGFVEDSLGFSDISSEGICVLLGVKKAVLSFLDLVGIVVDARELVKVRRFGTPRSSRRNSYMIQQELTGRNRKPTNPG